MGFGSHNQEQVHLTLHIFSTLLHQTPHEQSVPQAALGIPGSIHQHAWEHQKEPLLCVLHHSHDLLGTLVAALLYVA